MMNRRESWSGMLALFSSATGAGKWPENVWTMQDGKTTREKFGELTVLFNGPTEQLKSMVAGTLLLYPGMEPHPPHQHPEEEIMLVTEGHGEILVGGETRNVGPGALMYSDSNKLHGVKNTSSAPFRFYYFKWMAAT